ncbi:hypothetical protein J6590_066292 [Homalodisca vitripennis]|nr:hypothetical protein J6590_066292 [Homalodisca vitripennis]
MGEVWVTNIKMKGCHREVEQPELLPHQIPEVTVKTADFPDTQIALQKRPVRRAEIIKTEANRAKNWEWSRPEPGKCLKVGEKAQNKVRNYANSRADEEDNGHSLSNIVPDHQGALPRTTATYRPIGGNSLTFDSTWTSVHTRTGYCTGHWTLGVHHKSESWILGELGAHSDWILYRPLDARRSSQVRVVDTGRAQCTLGLDTSWILGELSAHSDWILYRPLDARRSSQVRVVDTGRASAHSDWILYRPLDARRSSQVRVVDTGRASAHSDWILRGYWESSVHTRTGYCTGHWTLGVHHKSESWILGELSAHSDWILYRPLDARRSSQVRVVDFGRAMPSGLTVLE